ncbi:MAG: DUF2818 domain-containing protein [Polaromonas sp.]|nr:DUF2818 domain-containing protein [Polaromonas sp.]
MSLAASVWSVIVLAVLGANLPFFTDRWLAVLPSAKPKTLGNRLVELVVLYLVVGGIALLLEQAVGQIYPQRWEFYATTAALFLTLAFPGFVFRYLRKS